MSNHSKQHVKSAQRAKCLAIDKQHVKSAQTKSGSKLSSLRQTTCKICLSLIWEHVKSAQGDPLQMYGHSICCV